MISRNRVMIKTRTTVKSSRLPAIPCKGFWRSGESALGWEKPKNCAVPLMIVNDSRATINPPTAHWSPVFAFSTDSSLPREMTILNPLKTTKAIASVPIMAAKPEAALCTKGPGSVMLPRGLKRVMALAKEGVTASAKSRSAWRTMKIKKIFFTPLDSLKIKLISSFLYTPLVYNRYPSENGLTGFTLVAQRASGCVSNILKTSGRVPWASATVPRENSVEQKVHKNKGQRDNGETDHRTA